MANFCDICNLRFPDRQRHNDRDIVDFAGITPLVQVHLKPLLYDVETVTRAAFGTDKSISVISYETYGSFKLCRDAFNDEDLRALRPSPITGIGCDVHVDANVRAEFEEIPGIVGYLDAQVTLNPWPPGQARRAAPAAPARFLVANVKTDRLSFELAARLNLFNLHTMQSSAFYTRDAPHHILNLTNFNR